MKYMHVKGLFRTLLIAALPGFFMMASCEEELVGSEPANTPTGNFDRFWKTFDTHYGLFEVKNINWSDVYEEYRSRVNDEMSDAALYDVMTDMIILLNDNHVNLYPTNGVLPVFPGGVLRYRDGQLKILKVQEDYSSDVVKNYLTGLKEFTPHLACGLLPGNVGYIRFTGTDSRASADKAMEKILQYLRDTRSLIIDIRGNYGGLDAVSQQIAGRFTSERRLYMTSRKRNGPGHSDFTVPVEWYVSPGGEYQYTKPVVVMTSRFTQSAAETFALAMNELSHVTLVGDTTAGSFSDNPNFELNNGWIFSISVGDYRAADGVSYEGVGIAPDVWAVTTKADLLNGQDTALEHALELVSR